jgi:GDPmannose 4,6-dehydratase
VNPAFYRPAEVNCLLGNNTLIINELGWTPIISFKVLVRKMVEQDIDIENS